MQCNLNAHILGIYFFVCCNSAFEDALQRPTHSTKTEKTKTVLNAETSGGTWTCSVHSKFARSLSQGLEFEMAQVIKNKQVIEKERAQSPDAKAPQNVYTGARIQ